MRGVCINGKGMAGRRKGNEITFCRLENPKSRQTLLEKAAGKCGDVRMCVFVGMGGDGLAGVYRERKVRSWSLGPCKPHVPPNVSGE